MKSMIACAGLLFASVAYANVSADDIMGTWRSPCRTVEGGSYVNVLTLAEGTAVLQQETFTAASCAAESSQGVETVNFTYTLSPSESASVSNIDIVNASDPEDRGFTIIGRRDDRLCLGVPSEALDGSAPDRRPNQLAEYDNCYAPVSAN